MLSEYVLPKDAEVYTKCSYVVAEIARVKKAAAALKDGRLAELGKLMFETHEGLSKAYEVSCKELDFLVEQVKEVPEVLGARMMGGGFGGCSINLVKKGSEKKLIEKLSESYLKEFGIELSAYKVKISKGTTKIEN